MNELGRVGDEVLELAVDRVYSKDGVLADVRVSVLEACAAGGDQRLKEFRVLGDLLKESEGRATDILVWMLLYVPKSKGMFRREGRVLTRSLRIAFLHEH